MAAFLMRVPGTWLEPAARRTTAGSHLRNAAHDWVVSECPKPWPRSTQPGWLGGPTWGDTHRGV